MIRALLFTFARSHRGATALANLREYVHSHDLGLELEVIDIADHPELADEHGILAAPTLVILEPAPTRRLVGELTDEEQLGRFLMIANAYDERGIR